MRNVKTECDRLKERWGRIGLGSYSNVGFWLLSVDLVPHLYFGCEAGDTFSRDTMDCPFIHGNRAN